MATVLYQAQLEIRTSEITPENAIKLHDEFDEVLYGDASCDNNEQQAGGKTDLCGIGGARMKLEKGAAAGAMGMTQWM